MISKKISIKPIIIGRLGSSYGILGWIRIFSFTKESKNIFNYQPWFIRQRNYWKKIQLLSWKHYNQNMIIKINNIDNRNEANLLNHAKIFVDASQFPLLKRNEYYWKDLIKCQVFTIKGYNLGKVINIIDTGANNVLVIKANLKDIFNIKERLIPFLNNQVIKKVDLVNKTIVVNWDPDF